MGTPRHSLWNPQPQSPAHFLTAVSFLCRGLSRTGARLGAGLFKTVRHYILHVKMHSSLVLNTPVAV